MTRIRGSAFRGCTSLTSIKIPGSVLRIWGAIFRGCTALTSVVVAEDNPIYSSGENNDAIYEVATSTLIAGCLSTIIPEDIKQISNWAMSGLTNLTELHICHEHPEQIEVEPAAFEGTVENCTLYVPVCTGYTYLRHPVFSKFKEVVAFSVAPPKASPVAAEF